MKGSGVRVPPSALRNLAVRSAGVNVGVNSGRWAGIKPRPPFRQGWDASRESLSSDAHPRQEALGDFTARLESSRQPLSRCGRYVSVVPDPDDAYIARE